MEHEQQYMPEHVNHYWYFFKFKLAKTTHFSQISSRKCMLVTQNSSNSNGCKVAIIFYFYYILCIYNEALMQEVQVLASGTLLHGILALFLYGWRERWSCVYTFALVSTLVVKYMANIHVPAQNPFILWLPRKQNHFFLSKYIN